MNAFNLITSNVGSDQLHITATINETRDSAAEITEGIYKQLDSVLKTYSMRILHERVFGDLDFYEDFTKIRKKHSHFAMDPFSYIQGKPCSGKGLAGIQIHAVNSVSDENYWVIHDKNLPCGRGWKRNDTTYVYLTGIHGFRSRSDRRADQASRMFDNIDRILASQSFSIRNVVRTWIYLADILEWYDEFNAIRTEKFRLFGLIPGMVGESEMDAVYFPASTGIGGRNPAGGCALSDVLAISGDIQFSALPGVRQRSAYRYGSAFSRGMCIQERDYRQIFVSGTAAIDEQGRSLYPKNVEAQIVRTLEIVEALISENGAKLEDIRSATVYLKKPEDLGIYKKVAAKHGLTHLPVICVNADICRDELLFEMDALAVV